MRCKLDSHMIMIASSLVISLTSAGISVNPLILDAMRRRWPAADSNHPSSFWRTMMGVITPCSRTLSISNSMSSSLRTLKGWSGISSIMSKGICLIRGSRFSCRPSSVIKSASSAVRPRSIRFSPNSVHLLR